MKEAKEYPEKLKILWGKSTGFDYEQSIVKEGLNKTDVLNLLDYKNYYLVKNWSEPKSLDEIIFNLEKEGLIVKNYDKYSIKALGALLLANNLQDFSLERKGVRVIVYSGKTKAKIKKTNKWSKGLRCWIY